MKRNCWMKRPTAMYKRHRLLPEIIQYAVWLYHRFTLSHRDIEDLLAERGITVSYEAIRLSCNKFGLECVRRLKEKHQGHREIFFILRFVQSWPSPCFSQELSVFPPACYYVLELRCGVMGNICSELLRLNS